jgi:hypothetical protein
MKGNKNCEFHGSCLPGALRARLKLPKIDKFSKIFCTTTHVEEAVNAW